MRNGRLIPFAFLVGLLAASAPLMAHHGQGAYEGKAVTLKGTVAKFEWTNPHCILTVAVALPLCSAASRTTETSMPSCCTESGAESPASETRESIRRANRNGMRTACFDSDGSVRFA